MFGYSTIFWVPDFLVSFFSIQEGYIQLSYRTQRLYHLLPLPPRQFTSWEVFYLRLVILVFNTDFELFVKKENLFNMSDDSQ